MKTDSLAQRWVDLEEPLRAAGAAYTEAANRFQELNEAKSKLRTELAATAEKPGDVKLFAVTHEHSRKYVLVQSSRGPYDGATQVQLIDGPQ